MKTKIYVAGLTYLIKERSLSQTKLKTDSVLIQGVIDNSFVFYPFDGPSHLLYHNLDDLIEEIRYEDYTI